ncbi:hypothetical protein DDF65_18160 [Caulobacter radicis]|uniref:Uncharacterized protein n=1 Tax=Caulobacter radicis TaxID=2172650 RepID=A0A2T9J4Q2_9CAUL|nr:hypothetical protein DDF65_18160 [Caulobacter radicis]
MTPCTTSGAKGRSRTLRAARRVSAWIRLRRATERSAWGGFSAESARPYSRRTSAYSRTSSTRRPDAGWSSSRTRMSAVFRAAASATSRL